MTKNLFLRLLFVEYRLTTIHRGKWQNNYCNSRRMARNMLRNCDDADYMTVYKKGPFFLPERPVYIKY